MENVVFKMKATRDRDQAPFNKAILSKNTVSVKCFIPWRYFLAVLWFLAFLIHDCFRSSLSITIVCMVNHRSKVNTNVTSYESGAQYETDVKQNITYNLTVTSMGDGESCYNTEQQDSVEMVTGAFDWSKQVQGLLLGAVFWGYMALQIPSGWLSERYGAHRIILVFFGIASISCLCTPVAAHAHPYVLLGVRIFTGIGIAVLLPALPVFWSKWAPPNEWSRLLGFSLSGGLLGNAVIFPFGGFMCEHGFAGGWPSLYYILGGVGLLWCTVWGLVVRDSPDNTSWLQEKERKYIEYSTKPRRVNTRRPAIPWLQMMTSRATIALITTHFFINYGVYMLITQLPTYMKEVLKYKIDSNGIYSMLPYLVFFWMVILTSVLTDCLISRWKVRIAVARKLFTSLGCIPPALCMLVLALVQCLSHPEAIALLCGAVGLVGFAFGGYILNYADIAMQFAGTLSGIGNCISTIPGIAAPYIVSSITANGTREEWQYAFFTGVGSFTLAAVVFLCFASGEVQRWARPDSTMTVLPTTLETIAPESDKTTDHSYA